MTSFRKTPPAVALVVLLCGCFNRSTYTPIVRDVSSGYSGGLLQTGTTAAMVTGRFFAPGMTVYWNGTPVATTYQTSSSLQIALGSDQTGLAGTAQVTATNDGGLLSEPFQVTVVDAPLTATGIDPSEAATGSGPLTVTVTGTGFKPGSRVLWNGSGLVTTFNSSTSLTAAVPASLLVNAGGAIVQVAPFLPCSLPTCSPSRAVAFHIGTSTNIRVLVAAQDMVWDATHALLFVAAGSGTVTALDPATAAFGARTTLSTSYPVQLAISAHDVYLYAVQPNGLVPATRLSLPGLTNATLAPANSSVGAIAAAPDLPETAAFTGYGYRPVGVFDGTALRGQLLNYSLSFVAWGPGASTIYGIDYFSGSLLSFPVDSSGVGSPTVLTSSGFHFGKMKYDRAAHLLYDDAGHVFDELGAAQAGFTIPAAAACVAAMDGAGGRMFFACSEPDIGVTLRSYDLATRQPRSIVLVEGPTLGSFSLTVSQPVALVRFGGNGLAVATFSSFIARSSIYLYSGAFVH